MKYMYSAPLDELNVWFFSDVFLVFRPKQRNIAENLDKQPSERA